MKKVCSNCDNWKPDDINYHGVRMGHCLSNKMVYALAGCVDVKASDVLAYWADEEYDAGICTGENFGCVHFSKVFTKQTN